MSQPLTNTTFRVIEAALDEYLVIVFREQDLDAPTLAAFGQRFGVPRPLALKAYRHPDHDEVSYIRSVDDEGNIDPFGNIRATTWHADATCEAELPRLAILHPQALPSSGGRTYFANMCAAYGALPRETQQRLTELIGLHGYATGPAGSS